MTNAPGDKWVAGDAYSGACVGRAWFVELSRPAAQHADGRFRRPRLFGESLSSEETELNRSRDVRIIQGVLAFVAALFGLVTIIAGTRILAGSDPGYIVFRPLLIYNTAMGIAYVAAGIIAWCSLDRGKYAAATIFVLNSIVLGAICYLYAAGSAIAIDSLRAMALRTGVWLALFIGLARMSRRSHLAGLKRDVQPVIPPDAAREQ